MIKLPQRRLLPHYPSNALGLDVRFPRLFLFFFSFSFFPFFFFFFFGSYPSFNILPSFFFILFFLFLFFFLPCEAHWLILFWVLFAKWTNPGVLLVKGTPCAHTKTFTDFLLTRKPISLLEEWVSEGSYGRSRIHVQFTLIKWREPPLDLF